MAPRRRTKGNGQPPKRRRQRTKRPVPRPIKRRSIIRSPEYFTNKVIVSEPVDHEDFFENVARVVAIFSKVLYRALKDNGCETIHSKFKELQSSDMTLAVTMIAILPMVAKRTKNPDNLPGLYFYGGAGTGKSYFFNQNTAYHMVPPDASGVSRYQQQANVDGYLLDDITSDFLDDKTNSSTLRNLALGGTATVKTFGNTQKVRGFIVCTSNNTPNFLFKEDLKNPDIRANCNAWKRRFIAIKFTTPVDEDLINAQYEYISATYALKCFFCFCYDQLHALEVKEMFSKYYLSIREILSSADLETLQSINLDLPDFMDNSTFMIPECKKFKISEGCL